MYVTNQIKETGSANPESIRDWCNKWIKRQEDRCLGGNLSHSLFKAHRYVFSTYVRTYTGATATITNGIDFSRGGLVWAKNRTQNYNHVLIKYLKKKLKKININKH